MNASPIPQAIVENLEAILDTFVRWVRLYELPPPSASGQEIRDDLARYVKQLAASFGGADHAHADSAAKAHGGQRWLAGYDLKSVILEYGVLRTVIIAFLQQAGTPMTEGDREHLSSLIEASVAEAAVEFSARATRELSDALAAATAAVRSREDVLAVVSHDLKNPLSIIHGSAGALKRWLAAEDRGAASAPLATLAGRIDYATRRMNRLITNLLDLSKLKNGGLELTLEDVRAADLLTEAREQALPIAEQRTITLVTQAATEASLACDKERVLQVFDNLLGNAIKFSPEGTTVTLGLLAGPVECTFSVKDQGPGIPAEQLPMLFERFWRAPRTEAVGGTGLGLAIAKEIVEAHHGRIWVESTVGAGTSFFFTLPRRPG